MWQAVLQLRGHIRKNIPVAVRVFLQPQQPQVGRQLRVYNVTKRPLPLPLCCRLLSLTLSWYIAEGPAQARNRFALKIANRDRLEAIFQQARTSTGHLSCHQCSWLVPTGDTHHHSRQIAARRQLFLHGAQRNGTRVVALAQMAQH